MAMDEKAVVCLCNFCSTWLSFPAGRVGQLVNCPYCLMETVLHEPEADQPYPTNDLKLEIRNVTWGVSELGFRCIVGQVVNKSTTDLDWVRVEFSLYNGMGTQVGTTSDSLANFRVGASWKFKAPVFNLDVVRGSMPVFTTEYGRIEKREVPAPAQPEVIETRRARDDRGRRTMIL